MEGVTLSQYKTIVKGILKDFDIHLTAEQKKEIESCETQREVNRIKDRLINERLKGEQDD